jgi:hypothetical protein
MRRALLGCLLAGFPATGLGAQTAADKAQLLRLEDGWATALVQRDTGYFRRTLAPGFVYSEDDRTYNRAEVLRDLVSAADSVTESHNEDMTVHGFGSTAVVTGWLSVTGRNAKGAFQRRYRFTDTWLRRAGRWQLVAAHDYLAPRK